MNIFRIAVFAVSFLIFACDPGQPAGNAEFKATGFAAELTQTEFNSLTPEQQYQVASKLLGTMFRGVSVEDFFDLSGGAAELQLKSSTATFLDDLKASLKTNVGLEKIRIVDADIDGLDESGNPTLDPKYLFDTKVNTRDNERPRQLPLARIKEYPVGHEFFNHWMAYFLANTIMFSPAVEMETTDMSDAQAMYRFLVTSLEEDKSVREIVRSNLPSLARWRVSRSAENHALEAFELYLGLFETEQDSYRGGIACKDYYLTPETEHYLIRQTDYPNTEPQLILDTYYITTCNDLYDVIAGHPLLMPRVTEVIINYLMAGRSLEDRLSMIESITNSGAETFEDIFLGILFSREYLLNTERPKSYEENLMPMMDALKWSPEALRFPVNLRLFINMVSSIDSQMLMDGMGWATMSYKIGRLPDVPLDALSFANYHKSIREDFLMISDSYTGRTFTIDGQQVIVGGLFYNDNGEVRGIYADLLLDDVLDVLFLSALHRKAMVVEKQDLAALLDSLGHLTVSPDGDNVVVDDRYDEVASVVNDYISRLPELYYFNVVSQEAQ